MANQHSVSRNSSRFSSSDVSVSSLSLSSNPMTGGQSQNSLSDIPRPATNPPSPSLGQCLTQEGTPTQHQSVQTHPQLRYLGWWWEIGAALVCVICTSLIAATLCFMDGKPMTRWGIPIQPNTLVAILSALAKSALLVPLAECVGQLKWIYFECPKPLHHMEVFDEASRGPWGSLKFLWETKGTATLPSLGAFVTILLLAFEPFAQQVVSFESRFAILHNSTGYVTKSNRWAGYDSSLGTGLGLALSTGVLNVMAEQSLTELTSAYCPTAECRFSEFSLLAVCATCQSETIKTYDLSMCRYFIGDASYDRSNYTKYDEYTLDELRTSLHNRSLRYYSISNVIMSCVRKYAGFPDLLFNQTVEIWPNDGGSELIPQLHLGGVSFNTGDYTMQETGHIEDTEFISYCENRTLSTIELLHFGGHYDMAGHFSPFITRFTCFHSTTNFSLYKDINQFGEINGTVTTCELKFCAKTPLELVIRNGLIDAGATRDSPLKLADEFINSPETRDIGNGIPFVVENIDEQFVLSADYYLELQKSLNITFTELCPKYLPTWVYRNAWDYTTFFNQIAKVATSTLHTPKNPNATKITGKAYGQEIFVRIRWAWLSLPVLSVLISLAFLFLTILESSQKEYSFKVSMLVGLFQPQQPQGNQKWEEYQSSLSGRRQTREHLKEISKDIQVTFRRGEDGIWELR